MSIIASFNYSGPSIVAATIGVILGLGLLAIIAYYRSILLGIFGGGIGWGAIAFFVFGAASGDMVGLIQLVYGTFFAASGAVIGGLVAFVLKLINARTKEPGEGP